MEERWEEEMGGEMREERGDETAKEAPVEREGHDHLQVLAKRHLARRHDLLDLLLGGDHQAVLERRREPLRRRGRRGLARHQRAVPRRAREIARGRDGRQAAERAVVRPGELVVAVGSGWSNAVKVAPWAASGWKATASRWDVLCWASPHACRGQPEAFKCSLMSPRWPAMARPRRHFAHPVALAPQHVDHLRRRARHAAELRVQAARALAQHARRRRAPLLQRERACMAKRSGNGVLGGAWLQCHGRPEASELLGASSRVRRAASSLQMHPEELMVASYGLTKTAI